jgi:hypothetical protein
MWQQPLDKKNSLKEPCLSNERKIKEMAIICD